MRGARVGLGIPELKGDKWLLGMTMSHMKVVGLGLYVFTERGQMSVVRTAVSSADYEKGHC